MRISKIINTFKMGATKPNATKMPFVKSSIPSFKSAVVIDIKETEDKFTPSEETIEKKTFSPEQKRFFDIFSRIMEIKRKEDRKFERNFAKASKYGVDEESEEKNKLVNQINAYLEKEFSIKGDKLAHFKNLAKIAHRGSIGADDKTTNKIVRFVWDNQEKPRLNEVVQFSMEEGALNLEKAQILADLSYPLHAKNSTLITSQMLENYARREDGKFDYEIVQHLQTLLNHIHSNTLIEELLRTAINPKTKKLDKLALDKIAGYVDNFIKEKREIEKTYFVQISKDDWGRITQETSQMIEIARDKKTGKYNPEYRAKILELKH